MDKYVKTILFLAIIFLPLQAHASIFARFFHHPVAAAPDTTPEAVIWQEKRAQMQAQEAAFHKAYPPKSGPPEEPGHWCDFGHLPGHQGLTPLECGYKTESLCDQRQTAHNKTWKDNGRCAR